MYESGGIEAILVIIIYCVCSVVEGQWFYKFKMH